MRARKAFSKESYLVLIPSNFSEEPETGLKIDAYWLNFILGVFLMSTFDSNTIRAMRLVLEEVCSHIPASSTSARTFVASRILECASNGEETYEGLLAAGRKAVIEQFGHIDGSLAQQ
jgi:hypothetical protein